MTNEQTKQLLEGFDTLNELMYCISNHLSKLNEKLESTNAKLELIEGSLENAADSIHEVQERLRSLCIIQESEHVCL